MIDNDRIRVRVAGWESFPWLRHGFSTRLGGVSTVYLQSQDGRQAQDGRQSQDGKSSGDLNLGWTKEDDPVNVQENRRRLVAAVAGSEAPPLITVQQVHSATGLVVPDLASVPHSAWVSPEDRALREADGLMTSAAGILLGIQTADCVPIFVVDTRLRAVANFHAGWRGTAARIVEDGIAQMRAEFGSRPEDLIAAVGPSIGACCYSVGSEVYEAFTSRFAYGGALFRRAAGGDSPLHIDLWEANRRQLLAGGITSERISIVGECTGCVGLPGVRRYFSHRCERGFAGRMLNVIGIA